MTLSIFSYILPVITEAPIKIHSREQRKIANNATIIKTALEIEGFPYVLFTPPSAPEHDSQLSFLVKEIDTGRELLRNPHGFLRDRCEAEGRTPSGLVRKWTREYVKAVRTGESLMDIGHMDIEHTKAGSLGALVEQNAWEILFETGEPVTS